MFAGLWPTPGIHMNYAFTRCSPTHHGDVIIGFHFCIIRNHSSNVSIHVLQNMHMFLREETKMRFGKTIAAASAAMLMSVSVAQADDIVDTAIAAGSFETLVAAVQAAGLVDTLKGEGPFTVFAPTDEAFAALPDGTVESLLEEENRDQLVSILTYHVIPGAVMSSDIAGQTLSVETVQGAELAIDATDGVRVGEAMVVTADIEASNGVIHVIDTVLIPE